MFGGSETARLFTCAKCGHKWKLGPIVDSAEIASDMVFRDSSTLKADWVLKQLPENVVKRSELRVLDVGCWDGSLLSGLPGSWIRHGVELNHEAALVAKLRGLTVFAEPLESVCLRYKSYDLVLMMDVVEHLEDPLAAFRKVSEVLVPGGYLFALTGNCVSIATRFFKGDWYYFNYPEHVTFFSPLSFQVALNRVGIDFVSMTKRSHHASSLLSTFKKIGGRLFSKPMEGTPSLPAPFLKRKWLKLTASRILRNRDHLVVLGRKEQNK